MPQDQVEPLRAMDTEKEEKELEGWLGRIQKLQHIVDGTQITLGRICNDATVTLNAKIARGVDDSLATRLDLDLNELEISIEANNSLAGLLIERFGE